MRDAPSSQGNGATLSRAVAAVLAVSLLAGCGESDTTLRTRSELSQDDAIRRVVQLDASHCGPNPFTLEERLPNLTYVPSSGEEFSFSDLAVRGDVIGVEAGSGFYTPPHDAPGDTRTDFDDRRSTWKTIHLRVRVGEVLAGEAADEIRVGLKIEPEISIGDAQALLAVDDAVFLLSREHVFFDYDASLLGSNPDTIITVSPEGNLAIPVLDAADERRVLGETAELVSLADAAARPPQRIERDMLGCD